MWEFLSVSSVFAAVAAMMSGALLSILSSWIQRKRRAEITVQSGDRKVVVTTDVRKKEEIEKIIAAFGEYVGNNSTRTISGTTGTAKSTECAK